MKNIGTRIGPLSLILGAAFVLAGCSDEGDPVTVPFEAGPISFAADIQPIFDTNCVGCHGLGGNADLDLRPGQSYANLVGVDAVASGGTRVVAGDASASVLNQRMTGTVAGVMPPGGALLSSTLEKVGQWINEGALEN